MNDDDIDSSFLISDFSSACITPKIIFNKEPCVIFLYQIMNGIYGENEKKFFDEIIKRLKKTYSDSEKVIVPKNIMELNEVLEKYGN